MDTLVAADALDYELLQLAELARDCRRTLKRVVEAASDYAEATTALRAALADDLAKSSAPSKVMRLPRADVPSRDATILGMTEARDRLAFALEVQRKNPDLEDNPILEDAERGLFRLLGIGG